MKVETELLENHKAALWKAIRANLDLYKVTPWQLKVHHDLVDHICDQLDVLKHTEAWLTDLSEDEKEEIKLIRESLFRRLPPDENTTGVAERTLWFFNALDKLDAAVSGPAEDDDYTEKQRQPLSECRAIMQDLLEFCSLCEWEHDLLLSIRAMNVNLELVEDAFYADSDAFSLSEKGAASLDALLTSKRECLAQFVAEGLMIADEGELDEQ